MVQRGEGGVQSHDPHPPTCPEFLNFELMAAATATSTSALSKTMKGAWPPSSMDAFFTVSAAIFSSTWWQKEELLSQT